MRPAGRFFDLLAVKPVEASIGIGLQDTGEVRQMRPRALTFAIRAVAEEHGRGIRASRRAIIAHIGPQSPLLGGAPARAKHRYRSVIAVDLVGAEHVAAESVHERLEQRAATTDPVGESRAVEIETLPRIDLALAVERQVIAVIRRTPDYAVKPPTTRLIPRIYKTFPPIEFGIVC